MGLPASNTVEVSRFQLWLALAISALSLMSAILLSMAAYSLSPAFLIAPLAPALMVLGVVALLVREPNSATVKEPALAVAIERSVSAGSSNDAPTADRPITVDEDREAYGIYATLQTLSSSLNLEDTLTLVADQMVRLVSDVTVVIFLAGPELGPLQIKGVYGARSELLALDVNESASLLAVRALESAFTLNHSIATNLDRLIEPTENHPAIAARLVQDNEPFGVILLIRDVDRSFDEAEIKELESVTLFAAAGINRARTQMRSQESALMDPFMLLPNHRAACGILDQRIAESLRNRDGEPVAVISLNLGDDDDRTGLDSELKTLCPIVGAQLRQMDILARGDRNELLIVLPRATRAEANLVAERIQRALESHSLPTKPNAHFGMGIGAFPRDGETATEILLRARNDLRPEVSDARTDGTGNVVPLDRWR